MALLNQSWSGISCIHGSFHIFLHEFFMEFWSKGIVDKVLLLKEKVKPILKLTIKIHLKHFYWKYCFYATSLKYWLQSSLFWDFRVSLLNGVWQKGGCCNRGLTALCNYISWKAVWRLPYCFSYKAQHFFKEILLDQPRSVTKSGWVL